MSDGRSIVLLESLGRGNYGTVYRGLVESGWGIKRPVAVKILSLAPETDHGEAMRYLGRTARRAACVRHPSFVQLFEVDRTDVLRGESGETFSPFLVTELVEGESLASLVKSWSSSGLRVPIDFATVVTLRAAEALGAALFTDGSDGALTSLVHGDLSPRQILVSSGGDVKVGDFGQYLWQDSGSHVRSRSRLAYTAPEIACGAPPSSRSDVFSLGTILHELLIGPRFTAAATVGDAVRMVRDGAFHSSALEPNLPRSLRDVIALATERNPMNRYPHARAMAFDLRREMLRLGLTDTQTCVRHSVVGWFDVSEKNKHERTPPASPGNLARFPDPPASPGNLARFPDPPASPGNLARFPDPPASPANLRSDVVPMMAPAGGAMRPRAPTGPEFPPAMRPRALTGPELPAFRPRTESGIDLVRDEDLAALRGEPTPDDTNPSAPLRRRARQ